MNKNEAQLKDDYGVVVGNILGCKVLAPAAALADGKAYNLVYVSATNSFKLTLVTVTP